MSRGAGRGGPTPHDGTGARATRGRAGAVAVGRRTRSSRMARREAIAAYVFISPWIFGFLVFTAGPMIASIYFSFTDYNVLQPPNWVGLAKDRKSTRLNSSHRCISYAVFCLKKKNH